MISSAWKNIAVFLDETPASDKLGEYAAMLAQKNGAHLIGIYGLARTEVPAASFARGEAIRASMEHQARNDEQKVLAAGRHLGAMARKFDISMEFRVVWSDRAQDDIFFHSLHSDLIIAGHPKAHGLPEKWSSARMLLASGTPLLIIPDEWNGGCPGQEVVVAWNASREARRAITDAMPIISTARATTVLVVDADKGAAPYGEEPGADIAAYLARHGAKIEVDQVLSNGRPVADVILEHSMKRGADLIILGAYSHSRPTEIIFGGVTRSFLAKATLPLLMSR